MGQHRFTLRRRSIVLKKIIKKEALYNAAQGRGKKKRDSQTETEKKRQSEGSVSGKDGVRCFGSDRFSSGKNRFKNYYYYYAVETAAEGWVQYLKKVYLSFIPCEM